jgi:hypothetical protein
MQVLILSYCEIKLYYCIITEIDTPGGSNMKRIVFIITFFFLSVFLYADNSLDLFDPKKEVYIFVDCSGPWILHCTMWEIDEGFRINIPVKEAVYKGNENKKIPIEEAGLKPSDDGKGYLLLYVLESKAVSKNISIHIVEKEKTCVIACPNIPRSDIVQLQYMFYSNVLKSI